MGCLDPAISSRARESHGYLRDSMENYEDALESSTEVCTGDSGEDSTRDLLGIQWGSGKDLLVLISKESSWGSHGDLGVF